MGYLRGLSRGKLTVWTSLGAALACTGAMAVPGATRAQAIPIRHVVVIYLENHSFDNLLGFWCDSQPWPLPGRGACRRFGAPCRTGLWCTPGHRPRTRCRNVNHSVAATGRGDRRREDGRLAEHPGRHLRRCHRATAASADTSPSQVPNITTPGAALRHHRPHVLAGRLGVLGRAHGHRRRVQPDSFYGDNPVRAEGVTPGPGWGCDSDTGDPVDRPAAAGREAGAQLRARPILPGAAVSAGRSSSTPVKSIPTIMDRLDAAGPVVEACTGRKRQPGGYDLVDLPRRSPSAWTPARTRTWSLTPSS